MISSILSGQNESLLMESSSLLSNYNFNEIKKMSIMRKGEMGYVEEMDKDEDGEITMDEFNKYCADNSVTQSDRIKLLETIQTTRLTKEDEEKIKQGKEDVFNTLGLEEEETIEVDEDDEEDEPEDGVIIGKIETKQVGSEIDEDQVQIVYSKKGDKEYDKSMDSNGDGVVSYEEYLAYSAQKHDESENETSNKIKDAYGVSDTKEDNYTIEATA